MFLLNTVMIVMIFLLSSPSSSSSLSLISILLSLLPTICAVNVGAGDNICPATKYAATWTLMFLTLRNHSAQCRPIPATLNNDCPHPFLCVCQFVYVRVCLCLSLPPSLSLSSRPANFTCINALTVTSLWLSE